MAIAIVHAFVSPKADPPDTSLVRPSNWNANHQLTMATARLIGRTTGGSGAAEEISVGGALSLSGGVLSLPNDAVTNAYLANMAASTIKGRITASTGDPEDLTVAQVTSMLDQFTSSLKGVVPASGGGTTNFLRADGNWSAPPASSIQTLLDGISAVRGATLYRGASGWTGLSPNTAGFVMRDGGTGADPSWVGGITKLAGGTSSGVSTVDLVLPSGYHAFKLYIQRYDLSSTANLALRVSYDNGSTYLSTSSYNVAGWYSDTAGSLLGSGATTTYAILSAAADTTGGSPNTSDVTIYPGGTGFQAGIMAQSISRSGSTYYGSGYSIGVGPTGRATNIRIMNSAGANFSPIIYALYGIS